ncbi:histone-like nucleoid-structuring protein Lsr2 [Streptomyces sp. V1I1]|uniref:Lsr2 family DNA-binding protein n=1 Tax=Streptomyces sp. V1I1 TaxID=3042272 RepID=UPI002786D6F9|nr:histone-like nucleoid-structuring protein Lsr2 [Streptomyces sp. V1I1]MDQ0946051.1 hypothetical protein [Streptomyces sp. V1I1]
MDWDTVENTLGMRLPDDYKQMATTYGPGAFCGFINIYHPHGATEWVNLTGPMPATIRAQLEQGHDRGTYPVPYDPADLFAIGVTDNGEYLFWITDPATEPDAWGIAVNEARGPGWYTFDGTLTHFLASVLSGETKVPLFPSDLLDQGAFFTPSTAARRDPEPAPPSAGRAIDGKAVRAWARANGYQVPDRGRIPADVLTAWEQATSSGA